ncbi:adenosylcobinamide-GDP ribazoletransferase [Elstera cyanobacteriorum]|uniref:Adenosylcobinamide-GDP ribazoletransferase n=1 Tax=Elstera cyanobacteriorum TaxID=2022747 RepID=A0A255XXW5_9PROT|nr:adenosylcobinamide-GDP ribazoletransferase [Elstera cyanobacteriorum]OYQ21080.1 adenosylcobinamide-GDP ribazoletransferase [Elstera cyanobacteriorum]GGA01533.1 adenosylcobinamide-GDP ribazoletransferase [Elstera cyanobacteriorum]
MTVPSLPRRLALAVLFLTRIPVRLDPPPTAAEIAAAGDCFPVIGAAIGAVTGGLFWGLSAAGLPALAAAGLALAAQMALTGALHEDGLADMADGFGGGLTRDRKLEIMRDSRLGTYGGAALVLSLLIRAGLLAATPPAAAPALLAIAQGASRWLPSALRIGLPAARRAEEGGGLTAAVAATDALPVSLRAAVPSLLLPLLLEGITATLAVALALGLVWWAMHRLCRRQIQGVTGDTLGGSQQIAEITLLCLLSLQ